MFSFIFSNPLLHRRPILINRLYNRRNMGTQQSSEKNLSDYKNNQHIGVYRQLEDQGRNLIEISRQLPTQQAFQEWSTMVEKIKSSNQISEVLYLPLKYYYKQTGLCGSGGTIHIIFDRWESFLKDEIASRRKNQHFYTEEQIWFIMLSILKAGLIYQPMKTKIGDLHPHSIVVTPEGFIRIITQHSLPLMLTNFQKIVEEINVDVYLAPEQMNEEMIERGVYEVKGTAKADAFSLGMVMLQVATLENCAYLYIRNPLRISIEKFHSYTKILKDKYSTLLYRTIMSLLEMNPAYRYDMTDIYGILSPYKSHIEELRPFHFVEAKQTISQSQAYSMAPGDRSVDNSRVGTRKGKQSSVPFSPLTQTFSFTKPN